MRVQEETIFSALKFSEDRERFLKRIVGNEYDLYKLIGIAVDEVEAGHIKRYGMPANRDAIKRALWRLFA